MIEERKECELPKTQQVYFLLAGSLWQKDRWLVLYGNKIAGIATPVSTLVSL